LRPGSYDFARDLYFQRIGASGFVHGTVKVVTPPVEAGWRLRAVTFVESVRDAIDGRIRSVLSGDVGSIASALITGKRDAITPYLYDAMFVSGSATCSRSPAITWQWSPASCSSFCARCWR
jgi:competence protein ComEC